MGARSTSLLLLTSMIHLLSRASAREFLSPGSSLSTEDGSGMLHSPNGAFTCGFHNISPNASVFSVWFAGTAEKTVVWSANHLRPVYSRGSRAVLHADGSMVVEDYDGEPAWANNVSSSSKAEQARLLDTGNLVVSGQGDVILWQSFDSPTDTLLPNQSITAATKLVSAHRLLAPGRYSFHFDDAHLLSLFDDEQDISFIYWPKPDLATWARQRNPFSTTTVGVLDSWGYFLGSDDLTFKSADWGPGVMRRLTLDYDGNLRLYSLENRKWSVTWIAFQTCFVHGQCGMNGICVYTPRPACACAPGHEVIDPSDRSKGCRPRFNLSCDGQEMKFVKLPSTDFIAYDQSKRSLVSFDTCKQICMDDCSCKGFSYWQGGGSCYPKSSLVGGVTSPGLPGSIYLKLPKTVQVSGSSIPQSQPFGPTYAPNCSAKNKYFTADFPDIPKSNQSGSKYLYFYGFLSAIFCVEVIFVALGCWFMVRLEGKQLTGVWPAEVGYEMITNHFRRYTYKELQRATRKFKCQIGRGASGLVYKGILKDKRAVAVKRLADINQGEEEFQHELSVIGKIYHMNLVRVWGFCSDGPHRILVLEYVENGSLDKTLFSGKASQILLGWNERFKIALGVAKGLAYLHHECLEWVIHCDLKPENILLDGNLEPKITDFGLAKLLNRGGSNKSVSRIHGTRGYIAPEWVSSLPITAKVDVYSFGVVLLELLKGARVSDWAPNADEEVEMVLRRVVRMLAENLMLEGSKQLWIDDFIDSRLNRQFNDLQARTMIKLAVSCVEEDSRKRPTMENAVQMLLSVDEASGITQQYSTN
ncbi:putative receptor protein kinase ZmPK1 [Triticum dicoccoides]|uniref:putative receptor protein kinase ZmPK1 n=1 Tax=Triticum dicoccoides TaxID=85692 RepID=UPI0018919F25|nr:putative receptor protein kinase ZmPK1 [Triticum dicoccoides]